MADYITQRDLYDIYPSIGEYDSKNVVYGWKVDSGSRYKAENPGLVTALFADGENLGSAQTSKTAVDANGEWYYDAAIDVVYYFNSSTNPQNILMEAGEDNATFKSRMISNATKYFNSKVDSTLPREMFLLEDGTYDYFVKRTVALFCAAFMIKAYEPESDIAEALLEEAETNILDLNEGRVKLGFQTSGDMSQGVINKISVSGSLNIIDTRGDYTGTFDKIKVIITTGGAIGTAKYSVFVKDQDGLKNTAVITDKIVNGDYQDLSGGLQIRFSGATDSSTATQNDEWEVEVAGRYEHTDNASVRTIQLTRNSTKRRTQSFFKN
tara:strand:+ start:5352 stop:6323 length:972 start_codon:yes stop_codon:yes gene_type:complete